MKSRSLPTLILLSFCLLARFNAQPSLLLGAVDFKPGVCGNGVTQVEKKEACDLGSDNGKGKGCSGKCQWEKGFMCFVDSNAHSACFTQCGDLLTAGDQECDLGFQSGAHMSGDHDKKIGGCTMNCRRVEGYTCLIDANLKSKCFTVCGDGLTAGSQECDSGQGCWANCTTVPGYYCLGTKLAPANFSCVPKCGDGMLVGNETCDLAGRNGEEGSGCSGNCTITLGYKCSNPVQLCQAECGDGLVVGSQACDLGSNNGSPLFGCTKNCTLQKGFNCTFNAATQQQGCFPICGDGQVVGSETCDLGTQNGKGKGCQSNCTLTFGFTCTTDNSTKLPNCTTKCGDGIKAGLEECDTGADNQTTDKAKQYGCSDKCTILPGFNCTVQNLTSICQTVCGDNLTAGSEQCDYNLGDFLYGCSTNCTRLKGFNCSVNSSTLVSTCSTTCGDGVVAGYQKCDLGSEKNGNLSQGCNKSCQIITGYYCTLNVSQGSNCVTKCGDGIVAGGEICDIKTGYGCVNCEIVKGYSCHIDGSTSVCTPDCGDGVVVQGEVCDFGSNNGKPGFACTSNCGIQNGYTNCGINPFRCDTLCGDGYIAGDEECDNGSNNGPNNPCLQNCKINTSPAICIQIDPSYTCSSMIFKSFFNLAAYNRLEDSDLQIDLVGQQPIFRDNRLLIAGIDRGQTYELPGEIKFNFKYQAATVRFPDDYRMVIEVSGAQLEDGQNVVIVDGVQIKLPAAEQSNIATTFYGQKSYPIIFGFALVALLFTFSWIYVAVCKYCTRLGQKEFNINKELAEDSKDNQYNIPSLDMQKQKNVINFRIQPLYRCEDTNCEIAHFIRQKQGDISRKTSINNVITLQQQDQLLDSPQILNCKNYELNYPA